MTDCPEDLLYTKEHEWVKIDQNTKIVTIGITDYAQEKLGDVVHVELPREGADLKSEESFGSVESVKAVSDIYAPLSGKVVDANSVLLDSPEILNDDPYGEGWMIKISASNLDDLKVLMSADEYEAFVADSDSN